MSTKIPAIAILGLMLAGCASMPGDNQSYASNKITEQEASFIAGDVAKHLVQPLPPAKTTLVLDPPAADDNNLTPALEASLRKKGFAIVRIKPDSEASNQEAPDGVRLRYLASLNNDGIFLRLQYNHQEDTRFYTVDGQGHLSIGSPYTVREGEDER